MVMSAWWVTLEILSKHVGGVLPEVALEKFRHLLSSVDAIQTTNPTAYLLVIPTDEDSNAFYVLDGVIRVTVALEKGFG
jgi:hypothetical protein